VQEAGGLIGDLTGEGDFLHGGQVIAANPKIFAQMVATLAPFRAEMTKERRAGRRPRLMRRRACRRLYLYTTMEIRREEARSCPSTASSIANRRAMSTPRSGTRPRIRRRHCAAKAQAADSRRPRPSVDGKTPARRAADEPPPAVPRIANFLAARGRTRETLRPYLDELFVDRRGGRKGFPPEVMAELFELRTHYEGLHPQNGARWDDSLKHR
jgi:hypothetical protein